MPVDKTGIFAIFRYMNKLYILMHREMQFSGKGDPDHWSEAVIAQSTDKSFIDKIVKELNTRMSSSTSTSLHIVSLTVFITKNPAWKSEFHTGLAGIAAIKILMYWESRSFLSQVYILVHF